MNSRQQIYSTLLLLIVFLSLACCAILSLKDVVRYYVASEPDAIEPVPPPVQATQTMAALTGVITDATAQATPGIEDLLPLPTPIPIQPTPAPPAAVLAPPPAPAALAELAIADSLIKDAQFVTTVSIDEINRLQSDFYPGSNRLSAQFAVDRFKLHFKSRNELGHWVPIRAEVFVPKVTAPAEFPLFVYGAGTTGIGNRCAPLDEDAHGRNWGQYQIHLLSYAAQGFITVLPHWQGYDDQTRTHNYFVADLEASTMLDATRAAFELFNRDILPNVLARPAQAVFFGGYSQGGHGAFAALDAAIHYAPELPIKGVVGHATAPSVEALLRERPELAPYIVYAYLNYYGSGVISPELVFLSNWLPTFYNDASTKCVDEAYQYYPEEPNQLYRSEFVEVLYGDRLAEVFPVFKQALDLNYVGGSPDTRVPVVLFHGEADDIVTPETHERFVARLCNLGKNVSYKLYPDVNHFQTRQFSFIDSVTWMRNILNGQLPESQCSAFFNSQFE